MSDDQLDLDAIDARAAAASAGPWTYDASDPSDVVIWGKPDPSNPKHAGGAFLANVGASRFGQVGVAFDIDEANGRFIAAARSDVPALVARVRELEARIERARRCCNCPALDGAGDDNG